MMEHLIVGFTIGFAGSLHCVGMCGPIVIMIKVKKTFSSGFFSQVLYHFGRIFTYSIIGFVAGMFGYGVIKTGVQQILSIVFGIGLIVYTLSTYVFQKPIFPGLVPLGLTRGLSTYVSKHFTSSSRNNQLILGILNGLLPCGLVYVAVANAMVVSNPVYSVLSMISFGLGTMPALFFVPVMSGFFSKFRKWTFSAVMPFFLFGISLILLYRGISIYPPLYEKANQVISICMP